MSEELGTAEGFVAPDVSAELPGLRLRWLRLEIEEPPDAREVKTRLRQLSDRFYGTGVVAMQTRPIHRSYRAFFRQTGIDPDVQLPPAEQAATWRLLRGELSAEDALRGAMLVALVETGVPVWALDADRVHAGGLGIRQTCDGECLGKAPLRAGRLVVADEISVHALLFGQLAPGHEATRLTERIAVFGVAVDGVSDMHLEEALWIASETVVGD